MNRALLLYNPASGGMRQRRLNDVRAVADELRAAGVEAICEETRAPGTAPEQAREGIARGCDAIIACGGDGTVHEAMQGMIGAEAALGVIPLGTGNALANDLGLPRNPAAAARALLRAQPRRVAVGKLECAGRDGNLASRYFIVTAGIGPDAELLYRLALSFKQRHGMNAYYAQGLRMFLAPRFTPFEIEFTAGRVRRETVYELLAVRVAHFGGVLRKLAPGAALSRNDLRLVLFKTRRRASYLAYIVRGLLGRAWPVPGVELAHASEFECRAALGEGRQQRRVLVEADGELLGVLPARVSMVPAALNLLVPRS
jgi:YegS/Rv2252/BmrU family lipid kinase